MYFKNYSRSMAEKDPLLGRFDIFQTRPNLGWTNYVHLVEKGVPEFENNVIVLDGDVPQKWEYRSKAQVIRQQSESNLMGV